MGMQHEPGYIPPAGKIDVRRDAINAQRDAQSSASYARAAIFNGDEVRAARFQANSAEHYRVARYLMGLPRV